MTPCNSHASYEQLDLGNDESPESVTLSGVTCIFKRCFCHIMEAK